jgi:hypothetical protein
MKTMRYVSAGFVGFLILLLASAPARSDDPVSSSVRFNREIVRIFDRKCLSCHSPGGVAMSLATYRDVRPWARAIREEIVEQRMPPWPAARGYARFQDDIGLTPRELTTILTWVDGGVPRGDESDLPAPHTAPPEAAPDHRIMIPQQQVPGNGEDVIRSVTVDTGLTTSRWIRKLQVRPGERRLVRAAFVSVIADGRPPVWAASWTPWQAGIAPPPPGAFFLPAGSRLQIELHYRGQDASAADASSIDLFFAPEGQWREVTSVTIESRRTTKGAAGSRTTGDTTLGHESVIWGLRPDVIEEGRSLEVTARRPDGSVEVLLWIPSARPAWPSPFIFEEPVRLPAGTIVSATVAGPSGAPHARTVLAVYNEG